VKLSIATGGTGGVYYPLGGGMASLIGKYIPNAEATAEVTPASVDNLKLIQAGKAELALVMADVAYDALEGRDKFKDTGKVPVRSLLAVYSNYLHIVTTADSGIKTVADLKGKRFSTGAPGSGTEVKCLRALEGAGINADKDLGSREKLGASESAAAVKDKKIDAYCWDGGLPTGSIVDLATAPGVKLVLLSHSDAVDKMNQKYGPLYFKAKIPKATYPGLDADVEVAGVTNLLVVNEKMDETLAYNITKTFIEKQPELVLVHPAAAELTAPSAVVGSSVPYHNGAIKYFKEKGVWK
jgi:TRAP transporter TAXI family solute receptor